MTVLAIWLAAIASGDLVAGSGDGLARRRRMLLRAMGHGALDAEHSVRGGRVIGCLERLLIFGFAVAGEPTAAAIVVAGKSLLRFPEASKLEASEYLVVGSLASWTLALAPLVMLAGG